MDTFGSVLASSASHPGAAIRLGPDANLLRLSNVLLANSLAGLVRAKQIRFILVILKTMRERELSDYLAQLLQIADGSELWGVELVQRGRGEVQMTAAQFANVLLMNGLRETSIGQFIDDHHDILLAALNASEVITEPEIPWQVPSPDPAEHAINPDLFVRRPGGYWDVYDLKLPLLERDDITTGARRRRRFVHPVEDGIAQLAHYRDVLAIPEHQAYVNNRYGVSFADPNYGLIVGNYENVVRTKIDEAKRRLGDFDLIDYDSLLQLYVIAKGVAAGQDG